MIAELLHRVAVMTADERGPYQPRPSMAGPERCIRQMVYQRQGLEAERGIGGRFLHVLDDSSWHEELTADWIGKTAFHLHSRQLGVSLPGVLSWRSPETYVCELCKEVVSLQDLHGHLDGILTDMIGTDRLWEHKALNHFTAQGYWNAETFPEDHFTQCAIYLRALNLLLPDIRECLLLIKNKNTSGFIEYQLTYEVASDTLSATRLTRHTGEFIELAEVRVGIVRSAIKKFEDVEQFAAIKTVPERPYDQDHWRCRYCPFSEGCWADYSKECRSLSAEIALEDEQADTVRFYKELGAQINDMDKQREELRDQLITTMRERQANKARAGEYVVSLTYQEKEKIDWEAVPLAVQAALGPYRQSRTHPTLRVTKPKGNK